MPPWSPAPLTVGADLVHRRSKGSERTKYVRVDLPRVGLAGNRVGVREAAELGDTLVEGLDLDITNDQRGEIRSGATTAHLVVVPVKQCQKASLRSGRPFDAPKAEIVPRALEVAQVPQELLDPQCRALADGGELSGLEVGETKGRERTVFLCEGGETRDDGRELGEEEVEALAEEEEVGVAVEQGVSRSFPTWP